MVVFEDFDFSLVCAETKNKFQEHSKDGKTYAEAEPDAEYFLAVQKIRISKEHLYCEYYVDNTHLGYHQPFINTTVDADEPKYRGLWSKAKGVSTMKALKFVKAKCHGSAGSAGAGGGPAMGQVRMDVYQGIYEGVEHGTTTESYTSSSFSAASVSDGNDMAKKKNLRSGEGTTVVAEAVVPPGAGGYAKITKGPLLYSIVLHYCAAVGLIAVGVLDPPGHWQHHRMLHPAKKSDKAGGVSVKRTSDGKEVLELADDGDDGDASDDDGVENVQHQSKKPKTEAK